MAYTFGTLWGFDRTHGFFPNVKLGPPHTLGTMAIPWAQILMGGKSWDSSL